MSQDMLQEGLGWLEEQRRAHMSRTVTYRRDPGTLVRTDDAGAKAYYPWGSRTAHNSGVHFVRVGRLYGLGLVLTVQPHFDALTGKAGLQTRRQAPCQILPVGCGSQQNNRGVLFVD